MAKKKSALGTFDDKDVLSTSIAITSAGDGLSKALAVDPQLLHHGEKVYVVLECEVTNVSFPPVKDTDGVSRKHTLKAGMATIVDKELVADVLDAQLAKLEEAAGITRLPFEGDQSDPADWNE